MFDGDVVGFGSGSIEGVRDRLARLAGDEVELNHATALQGRARVDRLIGSIIGVLEGDTFRYATITDRVD